MLLFNNAKPIILKPWTQISIHPMLLFNKCSCIIRSTFYFNTSHVVIQPSFCRSSGFSLYYFNTSHVVIQPTKNRHSCILLISINHDLKPFLSYFTNHSIENQLFVRNHVFTPFDRLFQKITW